MSTSRRDREEEVHEDGRNCRHQHNDERRRSSNPPLGRQTPPNVGNMTLALGGMGPMLRRFLFGEDPIRLVFFTANWPQAAKIYLKFLQSSAPHGILPLANSSWSWSSSKSKPAHQKFYGHSYTAPTPKISFLQQFGLACNRAFASHIHPSTNSYSYSGTTSIFGIGTKTNPSPYSYRFKFS